MSSPCRIKTLTFPSVPAMNNFTASPMGYVLWNSSLACGKFIIFCELITHAVKCGKAMAPIRYPLHPNSTSKQIKIARHKDRFPFPSFLWRIMMSFFKNHVLELRSKESLWSYEIRGWFTKEMSFEQDPLEQNRGHTSEERLKWSLA